MVIGGKDKECPKTDKLHDHTLSLVISSSRVEKKLWYMLAPSAYSSIWDWPGEVGLNLTFGMFTSCYG